MTEIAIHGAAGRMGLRLIALASQEKDLKLVGALDRADHPAQGKDIGELAGVGNIGLPLTAQLKKIPKVVIDFSAPAATRQCLDFCRRQGISLIIGTTGLQKDDHEAIKLAACSIAVLQSPNMSLGVNLLFKVAADMARRLGDDYDIEIAESHHRFKKDSPSGTAWGIADAILSATGKTRDSVVHGRHGDDIPRQRGQIGMHALRMGDEVGKHTVFYGALGERLEITHTATTRDTFVHGALRAARWLAGRPEGRYTMADVLGL